MNYDHMKSKVINLHWKVNIKSDLSIQALIIHESGWSGPKEWNCSRIVVPHLELMISPFRLGHVRRLIYVIRPVDVLEIESLRPWFSQDLPHHIA